MDQLVDGRIIPVSLVMGCFYVTGCVAMLFLKGDDTKRVRTIDSWMQQKRKLLRTLLALEFVLLDFLDLFGIVYTIVLIGISVLIE